MAVQQVIRRRNGGLGRVPVSPSGTIGDLPVRGRGAELGLLRDRLAALAGGEGGAVLVEGPPGSGRTRLLAEVRTRALAAGLSCRHGAGAFSGLPVPLGPLLEALCTGPAPLISATAPQAADPAELRSWTLREVRSGLARSAARQPLVICLDDVQWCDPATQEALAMLMDGLADAPILWVAAVGPAPVDASGALDLIRESAGHRIVLGSLPDRAVIALAADVLGAEPGEAVMRAVRSAQGTPRLVVELLRGLREEGLVTVRDGIASADGATIPRRVHAMVRGRLDQLPPDAREGLRVASVLDRPFTTGELGDLIGVPADEAAELADEAVRAGFLRLTGTVLGFRHDLVRQAVSETLSAALRRYLRREAVDVRLARGGTAVDVAAALAEAAAPGDRRAVALLREAAADLAASAPSRAAALSRRALELAEPIGPDTAEIVRETVELLGADGRYTEARALADTALDGCLAPEAEARLRLAVALLVSPSSSAEAVRQCRIGLSLPELPEALRARLSAAEALYLSQSGDLRPTGTTDATGVDEALAADAWDALSRLEPRLALDLQDRASAAGSNTPAPQWTPEVCGRAFALTASGQTGAALREADAGVRAARRTGRAAAAVLWSMSRARILFDAGRLGDARTEAGAALAAADGPVAGDFADTAARYALGRASVTLGDREGVRRCAADGARMMDAEAPAVRRTGAWLAALAADALGDTARVAELLEPAWGGADAPHRSPGAPPDPADLVVLARLALGAGRPGLAAAAAERAADLDPAFPLLCGVAAQARGLVDDDPDLLLHAVKLFEDAERPLVRASAAEDAGRVLGAAGDPAARDLLNTALDLYEESGAARDAARVRRRLRQLGVRRAPRTRDGARDGQWGLTAAEVTVARLVAQGATNRQVAEQLFLSRHTVNTHLRNVYTKWGINSRVDLARLVLAREAA
ncbi:AAA family ATPase [Actinomadura sp. NAK00032]|uniref:ATP-binding protein n=1 Tax=Actinomadura sp. NAK00032 TaxID=2742128 RepID=UPI0015927B85|nr:LuxR family transcriptional regulator [Actinomadura sp. NAK00032]QKW33933.1 AAA family ATPase [Actinomadura sp. NAK00032]